MASSGMCNGFVGNAAQLDELLKTQDRIDLVVVAAESTLKQLRDFDTVLPKPMLNALGFVYTSYTRDLETWKVIQIGEYFVKLLNGELETASGSVPSLPHRDAPPVD
jgi:hypothetical protein